jgi:transposase-like protein
MPWRETCVMDQKIEMISNWLSMEYSITELSRIHEVSRKTLYKWIERYEADQSAGLQERTSRPMKMPRATPAEVVADILAAKN